MVQKYPPLSKHNLLSIAGCTHGVHVDSSSNHIDNTMCTFIAII